MAEISTATAALTDVNISAAATFGALLLANFGVLIGAYVSLKVGQAVSDVKVGRLEQDVKNLANMIRRNNNEKEIPE